VVAEVGFHGTLDDADFDAEPDFVVTQLGELLPLLAGGKSSGVSVTSIAKGG